jgi:hypothetical protein
VSVPTRVPAGQRTTPAWLWWALLAGAVVMAAWAWFIFGFITEPSAVGRVLAVLVTWIALSITAALAGAVGAIGLLRREASGRALAWIAAIAMTLTGVGAIAGIPALIGLLASRQAARP